MTILIYLILLDGIHPATHHVEAVQHGELLAKGIYYVFESAALTGCAEEFGFEDLYVDLRDQRNAEIAAGLKNLGEKIAKSTGPEIVEALAAFGTNLFVSEKVLHAVGSVLGALQPELNVAKTTEAIPAIVSEQAALGEATSDLGRTMQKMEQVTQEKVAQKTAQILDEAVENGWCTTKKPKHPKKLAREAIEGSAGKPTPPRTSQQKVVDLLHKVQQDSDYKQRFLPDGRIRYYEKEVPSKTIGQTRGSSFVVEHNPKTGTVRTWQQCYDHAGKVNRVHPKMINGRDIVSQHYPATYQDIQNNIKGSMWQISDKNVN